MTYLSKTEVSMIILNVRVLVGLAARAYEPLHNTQEEVVI